MAAFLFVTACMALFAGLVGLVVGSSLWLWRTAPATRRGAVLPHLRRRTSRRLGGVAWAFVATVWLAIPPPAAAACAPWDVPCLINEGFDYIWDGVTGVLELTWDVITLDPEEFFEDFKDVAYNQICGGFTPLSLAISKGVEDDFDEYASPAHPIEPKILTKLGLYFKSSFNSVRIHEGCNLDGDVTPGSRDAITFGEHIYFKPGKYHPGDKEGFALLAHELTHVLQYRQKGFADFTCEYGLNCALGANQSCEIEQQAYKYQALVLEDQGRDGDGVFTKVDNCPKHFNPEQEDFDSDGKGNACDPSNQCTSGQTKHQACPANTHWGNGYDYVCDNGYWKKAGGWCERKPPPGGQQP